MNILTEFKELHIFDELVDLVRDRLLYEGFADFNTVFNTMYANFCEKHNLLEDIRNIHSNKILSLLTAEVQLLR
jgi:hypothetical protein